MFKHNQTIYNLAQIKQINPTFGYENEKYGSFFVDFYDRTSIRMTFETLELAKTKRSELISLWEKAVANITIF